MSDVIEFAKILRRIAKGSVWQEAFGSRSIEAWMLDAAIEEFEKTRGDEVATRLNAECAHWIRKWGEAQDRIAMLESRVRQEE